MFNYEKWITPFLFFISSLLKIGTLATLYSVYAHPTNAQTIERKQSIARMSSKIICTLNNDFRVKNK